MFYFQRLQKKITKKAKSVGKSERGKELKEKKVLFDGRRPLGRQKKSKKLFKVLKF
jgi:hypothetical protein